MSPAKPISANVSQLMSLFSSKSLLRLPTSLAETTRAPPRACEALCTLSYFADHFSTLCIPSFSALLRLYVEHLEGLAPRILLTSHSALCAHPQRFMHCDPLCDWSSCSETVWAKSLPSPSPLWKRTNSFSVSFLPLGFYMIRLVHLFISLNALLFLPRVWTELKQQPHLVHNP